MGIGGVVIGVLVIGRLMGKWVDPRVRPAHVVGGEIPVLMDDAHFVVSIRWAFLGTIS